MHPLESWRGVYEMTAQDWQTHFETLLQALPDLIRASRRLESPNPEDDEFVKLGIVGFLQSAPLEQWTRMHCEVIRDLRAGAYADEQLEWFEESGRAVAQFACVFYGFLLGLDALGHLSEVDRELAQALLPGFISMDPERIGCGATMAERDA
jgi:alkylation response protein AidB-like acyl-CoA dehydrogenase